MGKDYRYRPHIRWILYYVYPLFLLFSIGITWIGLLAIGALGRIPMEDLVLDGISLTGMLLLPSLAMGYFLYRFTQVRVSISDEMIQYKNLSGVIRIRPEEITQIQFPSLSYMGGWIKIIGGKNTIRLTVVIENIGGFMRELKDLLDQTGNKHRYDSKKFFNFLKTATYADQSWDRLYSSFWMLCTVPLIFGLLGLNIGFFADLHFIWLTAIVLFSPMVPLFSFLFSELWIARQFAKGTRESAFFCPPPNPAYDRRVLRNGFLIGAVFYLLTLIPFVGFEPLGKF